MSGFSQQITDDENDRIERIRIEIGSGLVELKANPDGAGTAVAIEVDQGREEDVIVEVVDGELIIEGPRNVRRGPEIQVRIATSAVLEARVKTGSGDITSEVPLGPARLSTGSGDVMTNVLPCTWQSCDTRVTTTVAFWSSPSVQALPLQERAAPGCTRTWCVA